MRDTFLLRIEISPLHIASVCMRAALDPPAARAAQLFKVP